MKGVRGQSVRELAVVATCAQKGMWTPRTARGTGAGMQTGAAVMDSPRDQREWVQPFHEHGSI